jgi:hypothetical protein
MEALKNMGYVRGLNKRNVAECGKVSSMTMDFPSIHKLCALPTLMPAAPQLFIRSWDQGCTQPMKEETSALDVKT